MTNPNRPQYQDVIEETWGQAVADTVVRRYATTADRDADLGAIAATDLKGQVIVIVPATGLPYLQLHDGTAWRQLLGYAARVYASDFQLPDYASPARIPMGGTSFDPWGLVRQVSGGTAAQKGYFAPVAGIYRVNGTWGCEPASGAQYEANIQLRLNGTTTVSQIMRVLYGKGAGWNESMFISDLVKMNAGDEVAMFAGAMGLPWLATPNQATRNFFAVELVAAS